MKKMVRSLAVALGAAMALGMMGCQQPHECSFSEKWSSNAEKHWHECECGARNDEAEHGFGAWSEGKKSCTTCGYEVVCQHTVGEWSTDATNHWKVCSVCGKKVEEAAHSFVHKGNVWQRCSACDRESTTPVSLETLGTYNSTKMTFGVYPQTIKAGSVTVDKTVKNTEITGADYYLGSDGAWYAECVENGSQRGGNNKYKYSDGSYVSEKNTSTPKTLYFKVEPVEWTKLSTTKCLVASKILTANVPYYESESDHRNGKSANNYEHSQIRAYLNGISYNAADSDEEDKWKGKGLLQSAFTKEQQAKIKTTTVDNSLESTGYSSNDYTCDDTSDKVFLLSYKEAFTDNGLSNSDRIRKPTDYAFANYCYKDRYYGGFWWLRSPRESCSYNARGVSGSGSADYYLVLNMDRAVVPALSISE